MHWSTPLVRDYMGSGDSTRIYERGPTDHASRGALLSLVLG